MRLDYESASGELNLKTFPMRQTVRLELQNRERTDQSFYNNFFKYDRTDMLISDMKLDNKEGQNTILGGYGKPRSAKSRTVIGIFYEAELPPTIDTVYFPIDELTENLKHLKESDTVIRDEAGIEPFGVGAKRLEATYISLIEIMGKKKINFAVVSILPRVADHMHNFIEGLRLVDKKNNCAFTAIQYNNFETFGHLKIENPEVEHKKFIDQYEKKKTDFLNEFLGKDGVSYLDKYAFDVIKSEEFENSERRALKKFEKCKESYESNEDNEGKEYEKEFKGLSSRFIREIVNAKHPELRSNNEVSRIVDKIIYEGQVNRGWALR
jgi:hypothetical protein